MANPHVQARRKWQVTALKHWIIIIIIIIIFIFLPEVDMIPREILLLL